MGDTNVSGVGGGLSSGHHHQLHHHQLHHHQGSGPGGHHHSSHHVASVGPGHHHDATTAALSFGLGFFPDPSEISSKSLPPFSSFGETEGLGEGLSGRLLDLGGSNGGPPPWDLYGEGLSARLIDVGAPTPLGLGIGVGVGLGLGFAPPPPSAVPAREAQTPNGTPNGGGPGGPGGPNTGPGGVQYRPWESKNHPDSNGNPPTLLELGRMMAVTPPPGNPSPNSNSQPPNGFVTELQLFEARIQPSHQQQGSSPKLPSFQSQFQHSFSSPSPGSTSSTTPAGPPSAQLGEFGHNNNNNNNNSSNGVRYPVVPAPVHPAASGHATAAAAAHPGAFVHHSFPASAGVAPSPSGVPNHYPLPAGHPASAQHLHQNGSSPVIKSEMDDSRSPFSSQGSLPAVTAPRPDGRKKEKRKYRASSMESSGSDPGSDAQVPSVSSTGLRGFKHPVHHHSMTGGSESDGHHNGEKQGKKKRKRCGECVGCMRKDNCAGCAPCRNDKSHQICKMRRCEKLTEKKIKVPREKGERTPRNGRSSNITTPQPSATPPAPAATSTTMGSNPVASTVNNWDRGYTPNASWTTSAGPSPGADESNPWNNGYPTDTYVVDSSFTFQQGVVGGGFHPPAPVSIVDPSTFLNGAGTNGGYRPRPSPQPQQIQIGGFSPHHLSSPHPSPGSGQMQQQQQNGRCGSVPPHYDSTGNNGHYSPRPPSNNPTEQYRNGVTSDNHPNGPPGYPSPAPQQQQQQQQGSNGYSGVQNVAVKGEQVTTTTSTTNWDQSESKRATPHEELNNRLKEKILSKQQQQQQHQQQYGQQQQNGQYYVNYNYDGNNEYVNGVENHFNPPSASSPADNVRLDVHVEQQQQQQQSENSPAHFLGQAHPQSGGTGGGAIAQSGPPTSTTNGDDQNSPSAMITSPPRNANHHCPHNNSAASILEEDERLNKLKNNVKDEIPPCQCFPPDQYPAEPGPYYTQLGAAESLAALRELMERRTGLTGRAIRFEIILYTGKEGKTAQGCPIAKWIIRRTSVEEKVLCLVKQRTGHWCPTSWIIVISVAWEGLALRDSDYLYSELVNKLNAHGVATSRRCGTNEDKTCACQGLDPDTGGASFSFGCSWSMFYNGCKYARSKIIRKFRLTDESQEKDIEDRLQRFATAIAPLYKRIAPDAYENQVKFEETARDCRLGLIPGRPFAGVTACFDFCAHSHKDVHDMNNGCTVVTTLTKHRGLHKPLDDEQLHVLPHYILASVDENASMEGQQSKIASGSVEVLTKFPCLMRRHSEPVTAKNKRKMASAQQQSQQPPVAVLSSVNEDAALLQSNQVSSSSVYQNNGVANNWMQNGSIESRIRALSSSNSFRPTKPTFTNWGGSQQYSNQQQNYWPQQQWNTQQTDPQWWNHSAPAQPSEMRPNNPIQPFQNLLQNQPQRPSITVQVSDNEENFRDPEIGGVAIALIHGSVLFECAKHELHATTALRQPDRRNPTRISLVLYQHHRMNEAKHGFHIHERKMELKEKKKQQEQLEKEQKEAAEAASRANMMMRPLPAPQQQYSNGMMWNQYQPPSYHYWSSQPQHYQNTTLPPINHAFPHQLASSPFHQNHHLS